MLIEGLLEWLVALPAPAVYLVIGVLATVENIIPPVPADTAVALGAFLAQRGLTKPLNVFLVTWFANTAGAIAVYVATRAYGRSILGGRVGRRLLSPSAIAAIEREYIRWVLDRRLRMGRSSRTTSSIAVSSPPTGAR